MNKNKIIIILSAILIFFLGIIMFKPIEPYRARQNATIYRLKETAKEVAECIKTGNEEAIKEKIPTDYIYRKRNGGFDIVSEKTFADQRGIFRLLCDQELRIRKEYENSK